MKYKYLDPADYTRSYKVGGQTLYYLKNSEEMVLDDVKVSSYMFGDISSKNNKKNVDSSLVMDKQTFSVVPLKDKLNFFEKVIGYVPCMDEEGNSGWLRIIGKSKPKILSILLILTLLIGGGIFFMNNRGPDLDDTAIAYKMPDYLVNKDPSQLLVPGYEIIEVDKDNMRTETILLNPTGNPCYFQYEIRMTDTKEVLYESKLLEPGKAIPGFELNREVDEGVYNVEVVMNTFDLNDYEQPLNGGVIDATLQVK